MKKKAFSHDMPEDVIQFFDELCDGLGAKKYRVLEAAILAFGALPYQHQLILVSANKELRELYLDLIRGLEAPQARRSSRRSSKAKRYG